MAIAQDLKFNWPSPSDVHLGHYDFPCFLAQVGVTFTGEVVYCGSLIRSASFDARSFPDESHFHPQFDWERNIGDGHYSCLEKFFTPCKKTQGRQFTIREKIWNARVQLVRSRIEHLNSVLKNHRMLRGDPYRGWATNLAVFVKISMHAAAVEIRTRDLRDGPRYDGYGPHKHNAAQVWDWM